MRKFPRDVRSMLNFVAFSIMFATTTVSAQSVAPAKFRAPAAVAPTVVTAVAHDFAFDLPSSIPAGLTTFRLINRGKQEHHLTIVRLEQGKTASDGLAALIKAGHGPRPAWIYPVGGPNAVSPGGESRATFVLEPGNYMAFCEVPGPDPMPHFSKGMVKAFVVSGPARTAPLPNADMSIQLTEYDFKFSGPLTAGHHVIAVTNTGKESHMMVMNRYPEGGTNKDYLDWAYNPNGKPAPGTAVGGVTEIMPGQTVVMEATFTPGHYGLLCFVPDPKTKKPHFMLGMQKEIDVK